MLDRSNKFNRFISNVYGLNVTIVFYCFSLEVEGCCDWFCYAATKCLQICQSFLECFCHFVTFLHFLNGIGLLVVFVRFKGLKLCIWAHKVLNLCNTAGNSCTITQFLVTFLACTELKSEPIERAKPGNLFISGPQWKQSNLLRKFLCNIKSTATSGSANMGTCPTISCTISG